MPIQSPDRFIHILHQQKRQQQRNDPADAAARLHIAARKHPKEIQTVHDQRGQRQHRCQAVKLLAKAGG